MRPSKNDRNPMTLYLLSPAPPVTAAPRQAPSAPAPPSSCPASCSPSLGAPVPNNHVLLPSLTRPHNPWRAYLHPRRVHRVPAVVRTQGPLRACHGPHRQEARRPRTRTAPTTSPSRTLCQDLAVGCSRNAVGCDNTGVGIDNVNVAAATYHGRLVVNTPPTRTVSRKAWPGKWPRKTPCSRPVAR